MQRKTIQFAVLFAASLFVLHAQQPPQERPVAVHGISIPSVAGLPFSATLVIEAEREWADGSVQVRRTISIIARDSKGRTHNEVRRLMPEYFHGSPELISVRVFDPETRMRTICDMAEQTGRREFVPKTPAKPSVPNPQVHVEDLGTTPLNGLQARGTRRTQTIYGSGYGNGGPIEVVDETWYSPELRLNLLVRHSDPRNGVETVGVSGLKREEPAATLFEAPPGCKIADVEPPPAPAPASSPQPVGVEPPPDPQP